MKIILDDVPVECRNKIEELLTRMVNKMFTENLNYNPIDEIVITADFESTLQKYLKPEDATLRKIINEVKSVTTVGKILPNIRQNEISFTILFNIIIFQSQEFTIRMIIHEFSHIFDYIELFSRCGEGPFLDPPIIPEGFSMVLFDTWSEYKANRDADAVMLAENVRGDTIVKMEDICSLDDALQGLIDKLKEARYSNIDQEKRDKIVNVAFENFKRLYLTYIGILAERPELSSEFEKFCNESRFKEIFGESLIKLKNLLEELYYLDVELRFKRLPEISIFAKEAVSNLNYFRINGTY